MDKFSLFFDHFNKKDSDVLLEYKKQYEWEEDICRENHSMKLAAIIFILEKRGDIYNEPKRKAKKSKEDKQ